MTKIDPLDVPLYSLSAAARWVGIPPTTLHKWVYGRDYPAGGKTLHSRPLIVPADSEDGRLSFANIAEAHILGATRKYRISMADVRAAIDLVQKAQPGAKHPLLTGRFYHRGKRIFVEFLSGKIAASKPIEGQLALGDLLDSYLERIHRDDRGRVIRLFPVRRNEGKSVVLNFEVAGGQPIIAGTGILVEYVQDLYRAGLGIPKIAAQYGLGEPTIAEAIQFIAAA
jgi:uncharacterized protein (DUF433 family)